MVKEIIVICYGQKEVWKSRKKAMKYYLNAMCCCEGSERERYTNIYCDLTEGLDICTDESE